ncbi:MAG: TolB family protein, partial [Ignavibacteria bacterium]
SPDGKKVSYLSNKTSDYGATSLFIRNLSDNKNEELIITGVPSNYSWSPHKSKIIFSRRNPATIHGVRVFDIYEYDLKSKEETQITFNLRAHSPAYSPDGKRVAFVEIKDGTQNIAVAELKGNKPIKEVKMLTNFSSGEQAYNPKWSPDGESIICEFSQNVDRSIAKIHVETGFLTFMFKDENNTDYRDPVYSPDGKYLIFSSDRSGIFNIYSYDLDMETKYSATRFEYINQLTNVIGGAFMPFVDDKGNLIFASFESSGYKINLLSSHTSLDTLIEESNAVYVKPERVLEKYAQENGSNSSSAKNNFDWDKMKNFNDRDVPLKEKTSYKNIATSLFLIPVLRFDNYTKSKKFADIIKPGLYFYSSDVLGRMGIFGGASINKQLERDLFLQFYYNNGVPFFKDFFVNKLSFVPQFDIAGYNITRKTDADLVAGLYTIPVEITYDLLQF